MNCITVTHRGEGHAEYPAGVTRVVRRGRRRWGGL